jgi:transketolase N-terminal domain/subunit
VSTKEALTTTDLAHRVRCHLLRMVHEACASHIGCLSMTDLLAVLYGEILQVDPYDRIVGERGSEVY